MRNTQKGLELHGGVIQLVALFLLLAGPARGAEQKPGPTHLIWHLFPAGSATPELASRVEGVIRRHFESRQGADLMSAMNMDSLLLVEGNEKFLRCGAGAGCLSGLGRTAGVTHVIAGEVNLSEGRTGVSLVLVEVENQEVVSRARVHASGLPKDDQLEELRVAMFEPQRYRGSLDLTVSAAGAEVRLDDRKVGVTPLVGPLSDLPAGEHRLEIKKAGFESFSREIRIPMGGALPLKVHLVETVRPARPFYREWPFWTTAGVGLASLATGLILHADAAVLQDNADACREAGLTCDRVNQDKADARYLQAYLTYGIGAAGLLAAGIIVLLDDSPKKEPPAAGLFLPPGGLGLGATVRF